MPLCANTHILVVVLLKHGVTMYCSVFNF